MKITISEARLNDIIYLGLKKFFFEGNLGANPRGCDIRIIMNMVAPATNKLGIGAAILLPNEQPPTSHDVFHEVDTDEMLQAIVGYLEDHWMKATFEEVYGPGIEKDVNDYWEAIIKSCMSLPEEDCAKEC